MITTTIYKYRKTSKVLLVGEINFRQLKKFFLLNSHLPVSINMREIVPVATLYLHFIRRNLSVHFQMAEQLLIINLDFFSLNVIILLNLFLNAA